MESAGFARRAPASCPVKQALIAELDSAHTWLMALNNRDVECLVKGDLEGSRELHHELDDARKRRDAAIAAVKDHMSEHGC